MIFWVLEAGFYVRFFFFLGILEADFLGILETDFLGFGSYFSVFVCLFVFFFFFLGILEADFLGFFSEVLGIFCVPIFWF